MAQWEYRIRKSAKGVHILRVKGLLDFDQFTFTCTVPQARAWILAYEEKMGREKPIIIPCPYVPFSRTVPMLGAFCR